MMPGWRDTGCELFACTTCSSWSREGAQCGVRTCFPAHLLLAGASGHLV